MLWKSWSIATFKLQYYNENVKQKQKTLKCIKVPTLLNGELQLYSSEWKVYLLTYIIHVLGAMYRHLHHIFSCVQVVLGHRKIFM